MESSLTGRMSGPLCELPGTPYLIWVILHCPHLFLCLIPTSTGDILCVAALGVQHWTQEHSMPQCLLSEHGGGGGGGGQVHKRYRLWKRLGPWPGVK